MNSYLRVALPHLSLWVQNLRHTFHQCLIAKPMKESLKGLKLPTIHHSAFTMAILWVLSNVHDCLVGLLYGSILPGLAGSWLEFTSQLASAIFAIDVARWYVYTFCDTWSLDSNHLAAFQVVVCHFAAPTIPHLPALYKCMWHSKNYIKWWANQVAMYRRVSLLKALK